MELQDCSLALEAFGIHERHPEEILEHFVLLVIEELVYLEPIFRVDHSNEHDDVHHCVHKHQKDVHTKHQQQLSRQNQEYVLYYLPTVVLILSLLLNLEGHQARVDRVVGANHGEKSEREPRSVSRLAKCKQDPDVGHKVNNGRDFNTSADDRFDDVVPLFLIRAVFL